VKAQARPPDETERAFATELRKGCPHCQSRQVVRRFRGGLWDFGLRCREGCATFADPKLAHRIAAEAAERAAASTGQTLRYEAFDTSTGAIEGAVRALAGG
jgi:ribosomal protein L37AE/L43A